MQRKKDVVKDCGDIISFFDATKSMIILNINKNSDNL